MFKKLVAAADHRQRGRQVFVEFFLQLAHHGCEVVTAQLDGLAEDRVNLHGCWSGSLPGEAQ
jgi:hypothetical protein